MIELRDRWNQKSTDFGNYLTEYGNLPLSALDEERYDLLTKMERIVSVTQTIPGPMDGPADVLAKIGDKKSDFDTKLAEVVNTLAALPNTLAGVRSDIIELITPASSPPVKPIWALIKLPIYRSLIVT